MIRLILRRLLAVIPTLIIVTFGVFMLVSLMPSDPAVNAAGANATAVEVAAAAKRLHLNDPLLSQYWRWVDNAVHGDLGVSYVRAVPVSDELQARVPVTLSLIIAATVFALLIAIPLGILSGLRPNGAIDNVSRTYASLAISIPGFVLAQILVVIFAIDLKWLPPSGFVKFSDSPSEWLRYIALPAISLGVAIGAAITRQLRAALVDELDANHIRTSWAIGGAAPRVVGRHGLKNAAIPAITIVGLQIAGLVGGTVIVEQIFSIPGLGTYLLGGIVSGDLPVIQGCVLVLVVIAITMSLVVDILYGLLNPKVRVAA
ncbi:MAG: ABC transporter permease [Acidimicrobiia bacterium]